MPKDQESPNDNRGFSHDLTQFIESWRRWMKGTRGGGSADREGLGAEYQCSCGLLGPHCAQLPPADHKPPRWPWNQGILYLLRIRQTRDI